MLAYETRQIALAGHLEPAYEIAGDTFDYAVSTERLTITITDAIGHGLRAALLGSLAVTTMRNQRRTGAGIDQQASEASAQLDQQFGGETYVTGLLFSRPAHRHRHHHQRRAPSADAAARRRNPTG